MDEPAAGCSLSFVNNQINETVQVESAGGIISLLFFKVEILLITDTIGANLSMSHYFSVQFTLPQ